VPGKIDVGDFLVGILSNIASIVVVGVLGGIWYLALRWRLRDFFGRFTPRIRRRGVPLLGWADVKVEALVSPPSPSELKRAGTVITIGSPGYNVASQFVEENLDPPVRFANDCSELALRSGDRVGDAGSGVAERLVDRTTGQVLFYLAGPSIAGTSAAAKYLVNDWRQLRRRQRRGLPYQVVQALSPDGEHYTVVPSGGE